MLKTADWSDRDKTKKGMPFFGFNNFCFLLSVFQISVSPNPSFELF